MIMLRRFAWHIIRRKLCTVSAKRITISKIWNNNKEQSDQTALHCASGDDEVVVEGWARSIRKMKDIVFIDVFDGTRSIDGGKGNLQVTAPKALIASIATELTAGCSLRVRGHVSQAPVSGQPELQATALTILGRSGTTTTDIGDSGRITTLPVLPRKEYSNEYLRQHLHLRHRTAKFSAVARVRDRAIRLIHEFMAAREFLHIQTPVLTRNDCEGAGQTFQLAKYGNTNASAADFFDRPVYLTVSAQLHLEAAAHGLGRVYTLNPVFRAENSRSRLHLSEFYMLEAEQPFITDLSDLLRLMEELVRWVSECMIEMAHGDIELASDGHLDTDDDDVAVAVAWLRPSSQATATSFPVLSYTEAMRVLDNKGLGCAPAAGLSKEQELALVAHCGQMPTFVINWPRAAKPAFYMKETDDAKVLAVDLLAPVVGEMAGGSVREDDYNVLRSRCALHNSHHNLDWYLNLRQFGGVPTAGFGLGVERYLQFLCNISNIKDTILFPRWPHNCTM